jgi:hypothetical protein
MEAQMRRDYAEHLREQAELERDPKHRIQSAISSCIHICEWEYAAASPPQVIREHCRGACEQVLPELRSLEFSDHRSRLDTLSELDLWYVTAVSGDPELARALAKICPALSPPQANRGNIQAGILRAAMAGDTQNEEDLARNLQSGYPSDFPPKLIELPLGVIGRDPAIILDGVRKIGTRFKGKWDLKKHREFYDKRKPRNPGTPHRSGTWEQFLETTKQHLFGLHWIFSWWAIAWLQIARHRGLSEVFEPKNRKAFSEWVPFAMIEMD